MSANRSTLGLALLVTVVMLLSSLGLAGAGAATHAAPSSAAPPAQPRITAPSVATSPTATSAAQALLTSKSPANPSASAPSAVVTPSGRMSSLVSNLRAQNVPLKYAFLPDLNADPNPTPVNGHVNPTYGTAPAPLGVAEYGLQNVSGTITPYTLSTTSVLGTYAPYAMSGLSQDISGPDEYGVQLNSVLNNVTILGTGGYQYWTQNVIEYSTYSDQLFFVSNVWNFSSPGAGIDSSAFYQTGPNGTVVPGELYYGLGGPITISYPFTLNLYLNSTVVGGRDAVYFNFTLQNGAATQFWAGSYDDVIFNSIAPAGPAAPAAVYVANGFNYNPIGLPDDFELTLGGPGGGSNFDVLQSESYFGLQFWNVSAGAYSTVPSAYGYGSETGETAVGAYVLWGEPLFAGEGNPNAFLATGPSYLQGLWGVSSATEALFTYGGYLDLTLAPSNAFVYIAPGSVFNGWRSATNWSLFQWAPYSASGDQYELDPGTYTLVVILANYDPAEGTFTIAGDGLTSTASLTLNYDPLQGVYTPLWAFDDNDVQNISTYTGSSYVLFNQQFGPLGDAAYYGVTFPWFGLANDYLFPVFPGILLWNTNVPTEVLNPPSFNVFYSAPLAGELASAGLPTWNDLQMLFYDDLDVALEQGANIGGWWYAGAYDGPAVSAYNVVFWNTSESEVFGNTFNTGGNALYLYGGTENLIANNTFEESIPLAPDPYASVAGSYGSMGIFEADYGNASDVAYYLGQANATDACYIGFGYCDLIFNNIFLTTYTADSPLYDPYYFYEAYPTCPAFLGLGTTTCFFDNAWNVLPGAVSDWATNIIGGPQLGGNYWWDYGSDFNPYTEIPYEAYNPAFETYIEYGGDYLPLTPFPLYQVTFVETGLPSGTGWEVGVVVDGIAQYAYSSGTMLNLTVPAGFYTYVLVSFSPDYSGASGSIFVNGPAVYDVAFVTAYTIEFTETGLPAGTYWYVEVYNFTTDAYLGYTDSISATANFTGLLPGQYTWYAGNDGNWWAPNPYTGNFDVTTNATIAVHYGPVYTLTVDESGLVTGTLWTLIVYNSNYTDTDGSTGTSVVLYVYPGTYHWATIAGGYLANPSQGSVSVAANATLNVKFATPATLTFTETGLATGAAWSVSIVQGGVWTNATSTTASITFAAIVGSYNYSVSSTGYTPSPATGTGVLPGSSPVAVTFTAGAPQTGSLSLTVTTGGAAATVNGASVTLPFSHAEAPGIYAIVVSASGYVTYYNNVSVSSGQTTTVSVTLTATSSSSGTSSTGGISTTGWALIAVLGLLAVVFLITTIMMSRRGRSPPNMTPYTPPPPAGGSAPPASGPAWSEGPAPPPSPPPGAT